MNTYFWCFWQPAQPARAFHSNYDAPGAQNAKNSLKLRFAEADFLMNTPSSIKKTNGPHWRPSDLQTRGLLLA